MNLDLAQLIVGMTDTMGITEPYFAASGIQYVWENPGISLYVHDFGIAVYSDISQTMFAIDLDGRMDAADARWGINDAAASIAFSKITKSACFADAASAIVEYCAYISTNSSK